LAGRDVSRELREDHRKLAQALASALRRADKVMAYRLSAEFYALLVSAEELNRAYFRVHDEKVEANPNFQIVMDSVKEAHSHNRPPQVQSLPLDDALLLLLLAITHSDKNSISYSRIDENTGKIRPTTFPLTEKLIRDFLAPFGDKNALIKRVLVIQKGLVIGNPAAQVAWLYQQRRRAWEAEQKAQAEQARAIDAARPVADSKALQQQEIRFLCAEFEQMFNGSADPAEKSAQHHAFQGNQLKVLIEAAGEPKIDFKQRLEDLYSEKVTRQKAGLLALKMSARLKRMMVKMGKWEDGIWREFQGRMQELGIWDGSDWLEKWNSTRQGKQHLAKSGKDYLKKEKGVTVDDLLDQSDKIQNKLLGQKMLSGPDELPDWLKQREYRASPRQRKVLEALARPERFEDLIELSFAPEEWEAVAPGLRRLIAKLFATFYYTDIDIIKELLLKTVAKEPEKELLESAKTVIAQLELSYNKVVSLFEQDFKLTWDKAIEILFAQQEEEAEKARLNSLEYQR
ncbi:MAG: hypothetical protein ACAI44_10745, partial [Candidatus Sericytochromatia bacterium]